ncbi:MAG TPA: LysM peptidoglycan-binding domain-containing protein [Verrucomicrobiae bacterium]|jgi:LysM repeat protein
MNNPNPFVPQGSLLEQNKRRSRMKLAVFCTLAIGVCGLTAMLIQGCKRETENADNTPPSDTNTVANTDTNSSATGTSNATAFVPPVPTNPAPVIVPPVVETAGTEYVVVKGDTLGKIAKRNGLKLKALEDANPGIVPAKLKVGQKLSIPAASSIAPVGATDSTGANTGEETYAVKSGDTLTKIARSHGTTVKAIESENNLSTTKIKVGQKLKMPAKAESPNAVVNAPPATAPAPIAPAPSTNGQ